MNLDNTLEIFKSLENHMGNYWLPESLMSLYDTNPTVILKYKGKGNYIDYKYNDDLDEETLYMKDIFVVVKDEGLLLDSSFLRDLSNDDDLKKIYVKLTSSL